jgi:outer membrane protein assembly factor BamA
MSFLSGWRVEPRTAGAWLLGVVCVGLLLSGCVRAPAAARGPFPAFAEFAGQDVTELIWAGEPILPRDSLNAVTVIHPPVCRIAFLPRALCVAGLRTYRLNLNDLAADVVRLQLYYRDNGYYGTRIVPDVQPAAPGAVAVTMSISPGDQVILRELSVEGAEEVMPEDQILRALPLREGVPFRRGDFLASADTVRNLLQQRGHAYAEILRNYSLDTIADIASVHYVAIPGPVVLVDSVRVLGTDRLTRQTVLRQITQREGGLLRVPDLPNSQRNLHQLAIVSFATVEMVPGPEVDMDADTVTASVDVRIIEASKYLLNTGVGYGSVDCFRTGARLVDRDFIGGGRTLEISGSAAKIGVGYPLDVGLENSLCRQLANDPFSQELTYRLAGNFVQPRLLGTRTALTLDVHAERRAELTLFLRESIGSQLSVSRAVGPTSLVGVAARVERGQTETTAAVFCVLFAACTEEEIEPLRLPRWSNALLLSGSMDRTVAVGVDPRGYQAHSTIAWASPLFGSQDRYLSALAEARGYHPFRPGWLVAGRLQAGQFLTGRLGLEESYIPPERRFYAGGPNTVRGFAPNALGPQAYVTDDPNLRREPLRYPLGGTRVVVASGELNTPSPVFADYTRLAAFVDAGQVWATGLEDPVLGAGQTLGLRLTPGLGVRFTTPVGPIRVDLGYNAYGPPRGPLYLALAESPGRPTGDLQFVDEYAPRATGFLDRLQLHIAVGQAF